MDRTEPEKSQQNTSSYISLQHALILSLQEFVFPYLSHMVKDNNHVKIPIFSYEQI